MASAAAYTLILLSLPFLAAAQSPAAAPAPAAAPNPVTILQKEGKFTTLLDLLTKANLVPAIVTQLNSKDGITIFAPTDDAFKKISATLEKLTADEKMKILTYHALPKYVSFEGLSLLSNPVSTLAPGLTLNFTGGTREVNVSTGVVNTKVGVPLYNTSPLGLFPIEDVLVPLTPAPGPAPSAPPPGSAASLERRVGWGALVGAALACLGFF